MRVGLILDPAHGKDTVGKRSPDGLHLEYKWSRLRLINIFRRFVETSNTNIHAPFLYEENEPGLTRRVLYYNENICPLYDRTIMFSLHNDAENPKTCDVQGWGKAHGIAFWTSRGETPADVYATQLYEYCVSRMPEESFRTAYWLNKGEQIKDPDYEANFTVLAGNRTVKPFYEGILVEWKFMTNKKDVQDLKDPVKNQQVEDVLFSGLLNIIQQ